MTYVLAIGSLILPFPLLAFPVRSVSPHINSCNLSFINIFTLLISPWTLYVLSSFFFLFYYTALNFLAMPSNQYHEFKCHLYANNSQSVK